MWNVTLERVWTGLLFKQQFFSLFFLAAAFGHRLNFDSGMDKLPSRAAILKRNLPVAIFPSSFPMSPIDLIVQLSRDVIGR